MIEAYIPRTLIRWYNDRSPGDVHRYTSLEGVIAFIDASGFTALTRRLGSYGREGPEILTRILNHFFEEVGSVVLSHDGDVFKFAGDALWAYFRDFPEPNIFLAEIVEAVEQVNASEAEISETPLTVHIGAERGDFQIVSFGDPDSRLESEPVGSLLDVVYEACDIAEANEIAIGPALYGTVSSPELYKTVSDNFYLCSCNTSNMMKDVSERTIRTEMLRGEQEILRSYLPREVLLRLQSGAGDTSKFQSEHREVAVLFANFKLPVEDFDEDDKSEYESSNTRLGEVFQVIQDLGGSIARVDPYLPGHKLLVLFGAPVKREDDISRALRCAGKLKGMNSPDFKIRCGLAYGALFCGDVGSEFRKEYTVMGEAVNMAARLMSKADDGGVILDEAFRENLPDVVETETVYLNLKGVGASVPSYKFTGIVEREFSHDKPGDEELVGRDNELKVISDYLSEENAEQTANLNIFGDVGSGKSALLTAVKNLPCCKSAILIGCKDAVLLGRAWLARTVLVGLVRLSEDFDADFHQFVLDNTDRKWLPLMADILDESIDDNAWTSGLSPELRSQKLSDIYRYLYRTAAGSVSNIILIDDFDKADEVSKNLLLSCCLDGNNRNRHVITTRESLKESSDSISISEISLEPPTAEQWWAYFDNTIELGKLESELLDRILRSSGGNPLYVKEMLTKLVTDEILVYNNVSGKHEIIDTRVEFSVPRNLCDLQLSRFDSLNESDRTLLKAASVYPSEFALSHLSRIVGSPVDSIREQIESLSDRKLLIISKKTDTVRFEHPTFREAVYGCVPESNIREYHGLAATILRETGSSDTRMLAYHYLKSSDLKRGFDYALSAALDAAASNSLSESAGFFDECRRVLESTEFGMIETESIYKFSLEYVHSLSLNSRYTDAYSICRKWRRFARSEGNREQCKEAAIETAHILWMESKYNRCRRVIDFILQSADSEDYPKQAMKACLVLAEVERRSSNFKEAEILTRRAIQTSETEIDNSTLVAAYNKLGLALWAQGRLAEAADSYRKSLEYSSEKDGMYARAQTSNNLAIILWELGDFSGAIGLLNEALDIFRNTGDRRNEAYASGNLASLNRIQGKLKDAQNLFLKADNIFERLNDKHAHNYTVGNMGDIDVILGDIDLAEQRYWEAGEFAETVGDEELKAECGVRSGEIAFFRRDWALAEQRYLDAEKVSESIGSAEYLTRARIGLARLMIGLRRSEDAKQYIGLVTESARKENTLIIENEARFLLGEYYRISDNPGAAVGEYKKTLEYAISEGVFELAFKSAVRILELDKTRKSAMKHQLIYMYKEFVSANGIEYWQRILQSPYFSYFTGKITDSVFSSITTPSHTI